MSLKDIPLTSQDGARPQLSSVWSCSCNNAPIRDILVSPHGLVGVAAESTVYLYAGAPSFGPPLALTPPARLTAYCFSADGAHFITGDAQGFVKWWEVHSGEEVDSTRYQYNKAAVGDAEELPEISSIVCSPKDNLTAVTAGSTLCIFQDNGVQLHAVGPFESTIHSVEWKGATELAVNIGTAIWLLHVTPDDCNPGQKYVAQMTGDLRTLACSPNGKMFAAGCTVGVVQIWDLASISDEEISVDIKQLPKAATDPTSVQNLEWDASGRFLVAAGGSDVVVWDMEDSNEKKDGKDTSMVCYGHGQKAKITALRFQPKGRLLATGADDCQVLIFDSANFKSDVCGGLVGCLVSGKLSHGSENGTSITALAWHPSGLILAGTTNGHVDAFEVSGAMYETPRAAAIPNGSIPEASFLIRKPNSAKKTPQMQKAGWGGEPLYATRADDNSVTKGFMRRRGGTQGNANGVQRSPGSRPRVYLGNFKQNPRMQLPENTGNGVPPSWPQAVPPHPSAMHWPGHPPKQMLPSYPPPPTTTAGPGNENTANPPHTPESNASLSRNSSEGPMRGAPPSAGPHARRFDRNANRNAPMEAQVPQMMPGAAPYHGGYIPYGAPYPVGYMPPPPYCYTPYQMPPHMQPDAMPIVVPGYASPHYVRPPAAEHQYKGPARPHGVPTRGEHPHKEPSGDLEEDIGSKSSEATNNGMNSVTSAPHSDASGYFPEGPFQQGQTLYVGNLAPGVEEMLLRNLFAPFGPITAVQVIRDRETHISRGFGFVTFPHLCYAQVAMEHLDSVQIYGAFEGRKLKVSFSNRR